MLDRRRRLRRGPPRRAAAAAAGRRRSPRRSRDDRPLAAARRGPALAAAASRRGRCSRTSGWPSSSGAGWRLPPDVLVGLLRRHRTDAARRARVLRMGGAGRDVAARAAAGAALDDHAPRRRPASTTRCPGWPSRRSSLDAARRRGPTSSSRPSSAACATARFDLTHRAVLVNFVARVRTDALLPARRRARRRRTTCPYSVAGLRHSLAELAATRAAHARGADVDR